MERYEADFNGNLFIGETFTNFDEYTVLINIFEKNGWKYELNNIGRGGYYFFNIMIEKKLYKLHIYLKKITFGGRESRPYEKRVQFSAALERKGFIDLNNETKNEFSLIIGIYKNSFHNETIFCAWNIHEWGHNIGRAFNCFVDIHTIGLAIKNHISLSKSSKGQTVCCFKPSYFKHYLENREKYNGDYHIFYPLEDSYHQMGMFTENKDYIPKYYDLFSQIISVLKNHDGISNINNLEFEISENLNLNNELRFIPHNVNESNRTELGYQLAWARFYLKKAGYINNPKRGIWELTEFGWNNDIDKEFIIRLAKQEDIEKDIEEELKREELLEINSIDGIEIEDDTNNSEIQEIATPFNPNDVDIRTKTMSLDLIIKRLKSDAIDLNTSFQRKANLWDLTKQSRLIESILVRFPLPAFYFDGSNDDKWLVVDGLQRISTLNNFVNLESFTLRNLEFLVQFNNMKFSELPIPLQRRIEEFEITSYIIAAGTPKILKFNVFKRINTGGLTLTTQEIRNALYQGNATDLINKMSELSSFKRATSFSISDQRMLDQEFSNRFLAFYLFGTEKYNSDLDSFLNNALDQINSIENTEYYNEILNDFNKSMNASINIFGNDAFRKRFSLNEKRKPINKALFDAWSVLLSKLDDNELNKLIKKKEIVIERFMSLLNKDDAFNRSISSGTGDKYRVKKRFLEIKKIIDSILN